MTRLIPGHDAPDVESAQVTPRVGGLAGALARALTAADAPRVTERRVSLRAVPAEPGVSPDVADGAEPDLGGPHRAAEHVALVAPLRLDTPDTPDTPAVPPIGQRGPANGVPCPGAPPAGGPGDTPAPTRLAPDCAGEETAESLDG